MTTLLPHSAQGSMPNESMQQPGALSPCSHCAARLLELKRQAMKVMMIEYHKSAVLNSTAPSVGSLFIAVYEQLRLPDNFQTGLEREQCESCSTHVEILKREAVLSLHTVSFAPFLPKNFVAPVKMAAEQASYSPPIKGRGVSSMTGEKHELSETRRSNAMATMKATDSGRENTPNKRSSHHQKDTQQSAPAAAVFFAKAAKNFNIPAKKKTRKSGSHYQKQQYELSREDEDDKQIFPTDFCRCLNRSPAANPPGLFKYMGRRVDGKVKIMLRIAASPSDNGSSVPFLRVDQRRKQVTLPEPKEVTENSMKTLGFTPSAPKLFGFDAIFESSASKTEICSAALLDVLHAVINGGDGCLIVYGANGLGKTDTMIGKDSNAQSLGVIPCAISWLYNLIDDSKQRTGARFSVRVSGVEIVGRSENLKDLLSEQASCGSSTSSNGTSPGVYLREDPVGGVQLSNLSELRAPTADKASFFLDAALAARTTVPVTCKESLDISEHQGSHMIYTLHVYQYRIDKTGRGGVHGGRSRLHLIDLSAWPKNAFKDGVYHSAPAQIALGRIVLSMLNGTKQVSYKDSKIARLLKDSIGSPTCRTTIINHVSPEEDRYAETLATLEMASKISRSRRRKNKYCSASSSGGDSSCDESGRLSRRLPRPPAIRTCGIDVAPKVEPNASDYTSSAGEESCDTVIYVGPNGRISDQDLTDNESPPMNGSLSVEEFMLSDIESVERPSSPRFGPKSPLKVSKVSSTVDEASNFIMSDCDDVERPSSPRFGPKRLLNNNSSIIEEKNSNFNISECDDIEGPSTPRLLPKDRTTNDSLITKKDNSMSDCYEIKLSASLPIGPRRTSLPRSKSPIIKDIKKVNPEVCQTSAQSESKTSKTETSGFIMSDCEDGERSSSPCFGPRIHRGLTSEYSENEQNSIVPNVSYERIKDEMSILADEEIEKGVNSTGLESQPRSNFIDHLSSIVDDDKETTEDLIEISAEPKSTFDESQLEVELESSKAEVLEITNEDVIYEELSSKDEGVIEVFVDENSADSEKEGMHDKSVETTERPAKLRPILTNETKRKILTEIILRTRPRADYFKHEPDEEDYRYLHMEPVTEKELRRSEKRIKKLLKGGVLDLSRLRKKEPASNDANYMSECETTETPRVKESSGYSSAPETENRRRRLQKLMTQTIDAVDNNNQNEYPSNTDANPIKRAISPEKRLSAEETRSILKEFVAKKMVERVSSSESASTPTSPKTTGIDLVNRDEMCIPSAVAKVKYIPIGKANITSTKLCRGSYSSIPSTETSCSSPPASDRVSLDSSYEKAETISMASYADSEDRYASAPESPSCDGSVRRRRSPIKIHYRWSTVFEEDEKSKNCSEKPLYSSAKANLKDLKKKKLKKCEEEAKLSVGKSPKTKSKFGGKSPKLEQRSIDNAKKIDLNTKSPKKNDVNKLEQGGVGNSCHSVSECSEMSESSGIASNDNSSLSQQSVQGSPMASLRLELEIQTQSPVSPSRSRKWFFSRRSRSSGYVSDGNITDSSRASSRSRRFFGSKSKLSTGHSSGYESMRTDGGISNVSGAESACEMDGSGKRRKKRFLGFRRRSMSDLSKKGRPNRSYWIDNPASDEEHVEYKVYQIEDIESRITSPSSVKSNNKGLQKNSKLLEIHRKKVSELHKQKSELETELDRAMNRLMMDKEQYKVKDSENLDANHPWYANELEREVGLFQRRLRVLKAHLEVITCFDKKKIRRTTNI